MRIRAILGCALAILGIFASSSCNAAFTYSIGAPGATGNFQLVQGASVPVQIFLTSTNAADIIGSLQLRVTIGDGAGAQVEPPIVSVTPQGLFAPGSGYVPGGGQPQFADGNNNQMIYDLNNTANPIGFVGDQLVATINLNTSNFAPGAGPFNFSLTNTIGNSAVTNTLGASFAGTTLIDRNFTVTAVPEPSSIAMLGVAFVGAGIYGRYRKRKNQS